jgi:hypothetical protein
MITIEESSSPLVAAAFGFMPEESSSPLVAAAFGFMPGLILGLRKG